MLLQQEMGQVRKTEAQNYETKIYNARILRDAIRKWHIDAYIKVHNEVSRLIGRLQGEPLDARSGRGDAPDYERAVRGSISGK